MSMRIGSGEYSQWPLTSSEMGMLNALLEEGHDKDPALLALVASFWEVETARELLRQFNLSVLFSFRVTWRGTTGLRVPSTEDIAERTAQVVAPQCSQRGCCWS